MEYLDIVDEQGQPTGEIISRTLAHTEGIRHRTSHIWIVRRENEHFQVLMQKRAMSKDSFPGKYDTSSAGHIQAGDEPLASGLRESWASTPNRRILHLPDASTEILQKNFTEKSSGTTKLPLSMSISSLSISRHSSCKKRRWNRCGGLIWKKHTRTVKTVTRSFVPLSRDSKLYGNTCTVEQDFTGRSCRSSLHTVHSHNFLQRFPCKFYINFSLLRMRILHSFFIIMTVKENNMNKINTEMRDRYV